MTLDPFVEKLRSSSMSYGIKISYYMVGVQEIPCQKHPEKGFQGCQTLRNKALIEIERNKKTEMREVSSSDDKWCFSQCVYPIDVKFLNEKQKQLYREFRPPEKKSSDFLKHPENEEIFRRYFPEVIEEIIKVSA